MAVRIIPDESWIFSQETDTKHFGILYKAVWKLCILIQHIHITELFSCSKAIFISDHIWRKCYKSFPTNLIFLCLANNYISVIVEAEMFLMQICTFFKYGILSLFYDVIDL